jgi:DNA-binding NtrC family response regulator
MKTKILLVDDDPFTRRLFEDLLRDKEVELKTAATVEQARKALLLTDFNLAILDQRLPDGNGLDLFAEIRLERPRQMAILITGFAEVRDAIRAVREGLFDYLTKPFENLEELEAVIGKALEMDRAYREISNLRETLNSRQGSPVVISRSAVMERLLQQVNEVVAPLDTTVLILGESGTGKELIAKQVHLHSSRANKTMLEINCGALSESLLEATLFGFEQGAFTGAAKAAKGYFEEANGGTLFLDEISDMSPKLQVSLLRVLQEKSFARLGSTVQRPSDFRLICATNKPLEEEVKAGRFRPDLYYRINVVLIDIPPLRNRREDILPLAIYFLDYFKHKFNKTTGNFTPEAISALEAAHWAGNVRELKHAVERAVVINLGGQITQADFGMLSGSFPGVAPTADAQPMPFRDARERFEREYFANLLQVAGGNVSEAARLSGISRQNFYTNANRLEIVTKS